MISADKKILLVFVEPTPYVLGLVEELYRLKREKLKIFFLKSNMSQDWNLELPSYCHIAPAGFYLRMRAIYKLCVLRKVNLIHVAGWSSLTCLILFFLSRVVSIPLVVESDTQLVKTLPWWKLLIKKMLYPLLFRFPVHFMPAGKRQMKYLKYYGVKTRDMSIAQMTVDVALIQNRIKCDNSYHRAIIRKQHGLKGREVVFLFVGRLLDWKGVLELLAAFRALKSESAKLWVVGDGPLQNVIKDYVCKDKRASYFGRMDADEITKIYSAADVLLVPSHSEPWGLVVNEAMAAGTAIIATDQVGCIDDLVIDGGNGFIIEPKNINSLLMAIEVFAVDPLCCEKFSRYSSQYIASWTLENEAKNMVQAWQPFLN